MASYSLILKTHGCNSHVCTSVLRMSGHRSRKKISSLPKYLFGKEKMKKKPHRWEKLYCCFKINYMQTLSLTGRDLKKKPHL